MGDEIYVRAHSASKRRSGHVDEVIAEITGRQDGPVALRQLLERGVGRGAIKRRLESGHLEVVHRGVYKLRGPRLTLRGRWRAATLIDDAAVLTYRSAAALWGMRRSMHEAVEVTIPGAARPRPNLIIHRDALAPDEVTRESGIPVTTPARTLLDLAAVLSPFDLERAMHEAEYRRLTSPTSLPALLRRHPRRRGSPALRSALESIAGGVAITRSELEAEFLRFLVEHGIPLPETNVWLPVGGDLIQVDCLWRSRRLIVELDGRSAHDTSRAFEADRARDRSLQVLGFDVIRITARALRQDPDAVAADIRALLRE